MLDKGIVKTLWVLDSVDDKLDCSTGCEVARISCTAVSGAALNVSSGDIEVIKAELYSDMTMLSSDEFELTFTVE